MKFKSVSVPLLFFLIIFWSVFFPVCILILGGGISLIYIYLKMGYWDFSFDTLLNSMKGGFFGGIFLGICIWIVAKVDEKKNVQATEDEGKQKNLYCCLCCDTHVFSKKGKEEVCPVCGWIDDPLQSLDPDYKNGLNKISLNEARSRFFNKRPCK